jgi:hypothetical protein
MTESLISKSQTPSSANYASLVIYRGNCVPFDKGAVEAARYK